jgi:phospholipid/cholesterol/gamma-HCH transport system ATP-binding protein
MLSASQDPYVQQFLKGEPDGPVAFQYPETPAFKKWLSQQEGRRA